MRYTLKSLIVTTNPKCQSSRLILVQMEQVLTSTAGQMRRHYNLIKFINMMKMYTTPHIIMLDSITFVNVLNLP